MTALPNPAASLQIAQLLATELDELEGFCKLLAEEQEVLKKGEADRLPDLAAKKSALASSLSGLLVRREQALTSNGFSAGRSGMEDWLSRSKADKTVVDRWQRLLNLADKARSEHELNGKLIAIQLQHNQQALTAILSAAGRPLTYGPDGQQRLGGGGRTLGTA